LIQLMKENVDQIKKKVILLKIIVFSILMIERMKIYRHLKLNQTQKQGLMKWRPMLETPQI
jgi:hypothetical protein